MHQNAFSLILSTCSLYFLPGSNFAPFEEVKVPVSNSADFFSPKKTAPLRILLDLGWWGLKWQHLGQNYFQGRLVTTSTFTLSTCKIHIIIGQFGYVLLILYNTYMYMYYHIPLIGFICFILSGLWFLRILISGILFFYESPFASKCSWMKRRKGQKEVACIVSKHLVSCLWGCGESVNPPKLNIQEVLQTKGRPRPAKAKVVRVITIPETREMIEQNSQFVNKNKNFAIFLPFPCK